MSLLPECQELWSTLTGPETPALSLEADRDIHRLSTGKASSASIGIPNLHSPTMATDLQTRSKSCDGVLKGKVEGS